MAETKTKPRFKEKVAVTTMTVDSADGKPLIFNASRVGPMNWFDLRQADYGKDFVMPTMPQLAPLIYSALENKEGYDSAKKVVQAMHSYWLTGNTARLWGEEGLLVQDNPEVAEKRIIMDEKALRSSLKKESDGVYRSANGLVRFAPYGFKVGKQSDSDISKNTGLIATIGTEANAGLIARASQHYKLSPWFSRYGEPLKQSVIDVIGVYADDFDNRLDIGGGSPRYYNWCSFGCVR